jgi:anti-sigma regulatory factor (Ser/Thr protein kinase)
VTTVVLPCAAASVAEGRRFVSALLDEIGLAEHCHEAVLLTSELLTNSILHGHGDPRLDVTWQGAEVEIAVTDRGTWSPRRSSLDLGATSGRGLQLLERIASRYGTRDSATGTTIRFTLRAADPGVPGPRETSEGGAMLTSARRSSPPQ